MDDLELERILEEIQRESLAESIEGAPLSEGYTIVAVGEEPAAEESVAEVSAAAESVEAEPADEEMTVADEPDEEPLEEEVSVEEDEPETADEPDEEPMRMAAEDEAVEDTTPVSPSRDEEKTQVIHLSEGVDTLPESEAMTRVLPLADEASAESEEEEDDGIEQLQWDQLGLQEELPEEEPMDEEELQQALWEARRKQMEQFRLNQEKESPRIKLVGEEEEINDPDEEPEPEPEETVPQELESYEDGKVLLRELRFRRTTGLAMAALVVLLELILSVLSLVIGLSGGLKTDVMVFLVVQLVLLGVMMAGGYSVIRDGVAALLSGKPSNETPAALAVLLVLAHTVMQFFVPQQAASGVTEILTALAGFHLMGCVLARQFRLSRICRNLRFAASRKIEKWGARRIADEKTAMLIGHHAVAAGCPRIVYYKKASFLRHFLACSYDKEEPSRVSVWQLVVTAGASLLLGVLYGVTVPDTSLAAAITAGVAVFTLAIPTVSLAENFLLSRAAAKTREAGGMLSGRAAVEEFGDVDGIAVDAAELFPAASGIQLLGIKTFADAQIDTAILDAAAVCIKAGSPLAGVFRRVIEDREDYLQEVDTLVYEQGMGISGWVGGRRVLVGNRQLLQNHGVDVPSGDFEQRHLQEGRQPVYLSTAGALSALFIVSYQADPTLAKALRRITAQGISVLIRSCDPNITEKLVCDTFDLDEYYIDVLSSAAGSAYVGLVGDEQGEEEALMAGDGRLLGRIRGLTLCHRLWKLRRFMKGWQIVGGLLALAGYALLLFVGGVMPTMPLLLGYTLLWTAVSFVWGTLRLR